MIIIKNMFCSGIMFFFPFPQTLNQNSDSSNSLTIPASKPDTTYCVKVRSIPSSTYFKGKWSEWSPLKCWRTEPGEGEGTLSAHYSVDVLIRRVCCLLFGDARLICFHNEHFRPCPRERVLCAACWMTMKFLETSDKAVSPFEFLTAPL